MRITKPLTVALDSTNVAESSYDEWSVSTPYTVGDKVYYDPDNALVYHEFEALTNHTGSAPAINGTTDWLDLGPANSRAMFDDRTSTQTLVDEELVVSVIPGAFFDRIALLNITGCTTINITITEGEATLYDEDFDVSGNAEDWDEYFFGEDEDNLAALAVVPGIFAEGSPGRSSLVLNPSVFYAACTVTLTLTGTSGIDVGLGLLVIGRSRYLGETLSAPSLSIEDYSTKETDAFGNTYLVERPYADVVSVEFILDTIQVDNVRRELAKFRATPVLYDLNNVGSSYESLVVFGYYEQFDIKLSIDQKSFCTLRVQSLV